MASGVYGRIHVNNSDGSFHEEVIVPLGREMLRGLRPGDWVCIHFWDREPMWLEQCQGGMVAGPHGEEELGEVGGAGSGKVARALESSE